MSSFLRRLASGATSWGAYAEARITLDGVVLAVDAGASKVAEASDAACRASRPRAVQVALAEGRIGKEAFKSIARRATEKVTTSATVRCSTRRCARVPWLAMFSSWC